jgi:hypothetical protein
MAIIRPRLLDFDVTDFSCQLSQQFRSTVDSSSWRIELPRTSSCRVDFVQYNVLTLREPVFRADSNLHIRMCTAKTPQLLSDDSTSSLYIALFNSILWHWILLHCLVKGFWSDKKSGMTVNKPGYFIVTFCELDCPGSESQQAQDVFLASKNLPPQLGVQSASYALGTRIFMRR